MSVELRDPLCRRGHVMDCDCDRITDAMVEKAARAVEKFNTAQYEWTDEQFEVWWNEDPTFVERIHGWGNFRGTQKQKLLHEMRTALEAAFK